MIDPKTLTPESLYGLQSETWSQGSAYERERIIKVLKDYAPHLTTSGLMQLIDVGIDGDPSESIQSLEDAIEIGRHQEQERIIKLLDTSRMCTCRDGCKTDINPVAFVIEELGLNMMDLIRGKI